MYFNITLDIVLHLFSDQENIKHRVPIFSIPDSWRYAAMTFGTLSLWGLALPVDSCSSLNAWYYLLCAVVGSYQTLFRLRWNVMHRLALLSDASSLATKLETRMHEMESWLDDINAEDSLVCTDGDLYTDVEKLKLQRHSVMVEL